MIPISITAAPFVCLVTITHRMGGTLLRFVRRARNVCLANLANGRIRLFEYGYIVDKCWKWLAKQYDYIHLDQYVVMPNHLHGIIRIGDSHITPIVGAVRELPPNRTALTSDTPKRKSLSRLIGAFKTVSTKQINIIRNRPGYKLWQRNYYEHIIRDEEELNSIRQYTADNSANWQTDKENPNIDIM